MGLWKYLQAEVDQPDPQIDIAKAALHIAQVLAQSEHPDLELAPSLARLDDMAAVLSDRLPPERYPLKVIRVINQYLFDEQGFSGNQADYYNPHNSFLNDVLERRTGIPLTLSIVYLELAKRLEFPMVGVGMPGHFIIRPQVAEMELYVDPFHAGEVLFVEDCERRLSEVYRRPITLQPGMLPEVSSRLILVRMLTNLKVIYLKTSQFGQAVKAIDGLLVLTPDSAQEVRDRGLVLYELERWSEAQTSLLHYLALQPQAEDRTMVKQILDHMARMS